MAKQTHFTVNQSFHIPVMPGLGPVPVRFTFGYVPGVKSEYMVRYEWRRIPANPSRKPAAHRPDRHGPK